MESLIINDTAFTVKTVDSHANPDPDNHGVHWNYCDHAAQPG